MPRSQATKVENKFVRGLVTEATGLTFPKDACTETFNCEFHETGKALRRYGIDYELGFKRHIMQVNTTSSVVSTEYTWRSVANDGDITFLVQQIDGTLYFFDVSHDDTVSDSLSAFEIDLQARKVTSAGGEPRDHSCSFTNVNGDLVVVNKYTEPFYVRYNKATDDLSAHTIIIKIRDMYGLPDELQDQERPTASVSSLRSSHPAHYYNILNQGWGHINGAVLNDWDTAFTTMPSNRDVWYLYRSSISNRFDSALVTQQSFGTRDPIRGHFILNAFQPDRVNAVTALGGVFTSPFSFGSVSTQIGTLGGAIGDFSVPGRAFDNEEREPHTDCAFRPAGSSTGFIGLNIIPYSNRRIRKVRFTGSTNKGLVDSKLAGIDQVTIQLRGKTGTIPVTGTEGTVLGSVVVNDKSDQGSWINIESTDTVTHWDHVWIRVAATTAGINNNGIYIGEVQFFDFTPGDFSINYLPERPTCTAFFAGRVWYTGVSREGVNNEVFFSQIAEDFKQYGRCFQRNDPTNERIPDLLADDGGTVRIIEMGQPHYMCTAYNSLFVFSSNGVWQIQGSQGQFFRADDYVIKKLSSEGVSSKHSFVVIDGIPYWLTPSGVFRLQYNPDYNSVEVTNLSDASIKEFIRDLTSNEVEYAKGIHDVYKNRIIWLYGTVPYRYTKALVLNLISGAFYPWTFDTTNGIVICGGASVADSKSNQITDTKFATWHTEIEGSVQFTYADMATKTFKDWERFAKVEGDLQSISALTKIGNSTVNTAKWFDGVNSGAFAAEASHRTGAADIYQGVTFTTPTPVTKVIIYGSNDQGFVSGSNPGMTLSLYGKTGSAPANGTDGTEIGSLAFTDSTNMSAGLIIDSQDTTTAWDHVWVYMLPDTGSYTLGFTELKFYGGSNPTSLTRDYESYFITGYAIDNEGNKDFQSNFVSVFMDEETNASCFVRSLFDFGSSGNSGRWSTSQQAYYTRSAKVHNRFVRISRLKLRGSGKALQLKFSSETAKPFSVIGWSIWETGNANL